MERVGAKFDDATTAITQAHKRSKLIEVDLEAAKMNVLVLQGKLVETEALLKKAEDNIFFLKREVDLQLRTSMT